MSFIFQTIRMCEIYLSGVLLHGCIIDISNEERHARMSYNYRMNVDEFDITTFEQQLYNVRTIIKMKNKKIPHCRNNSKI